VRFSDEDGVRIEYEYEYESLDSDSENRTGPVSRARLLDLTRGLGAGGIREGYDLASVELVQ
jgi:hypothetical protein